MRAVGCFDCGGKKYNVMNETPRETTQSMRALSVVTNKHDANDNISERRTRVQGTHLCFPVLKNHVSAL